jgi:hypothetical protein
MNNDSGSKRLWDGVRECLTSQRGKLLLWGRDDLANRK